MLLLPLGLAPRYIEDGSSEIPVIVYGNGSEPFRTGVLNFRLSEQTLRYFEQVQPFSPGDAAWIPFENESVPVPFQTEDGRPDLIASAFFWLSGWQESTIARRDVYGRFPYQASLQALWNIGDIPVVDVYRELIAAELENAGHAVPRRMWGSKSWSFLVTHDVDALRFRRTSQYLNEVLPGAQRKTLRDRIANIKMITGDAAGKQNELADGLHRLFDECFTRGCRATYFVKAGKSAAQDSAYSLKKGVFPEFANRALATGCEIGLHPSFFAHTNGDLMRRERDALLEAIAPQPVACVRQHYLRYDHRITPALQEECGFRIDATLGFADREGFRRGTCMPFRVFDVIEDKALDLWAYPLAMMDATVFEYRRMTPAEACERTKHLMRVTKRFGGVFVGIWHNNIFDETAYPGRRTHFCFALDEALRLDACMDTASETLRRWQSRQIPVHAA